LRAVAHLTTFDSATAYARAQRRPTPIGQARLKEALMDKVNRGRFLKAGGATGAAALIGLPGLPTSLVEEHPQPVETPGHVMDEPILVYVRDADRGEVTVMHGTKEATIRDRVLVRRLLKAAKLTTERAAWEVG
jgi:hypothetical protein